MPDKILIEGFSNDNEEFTEPPCFIKIILRKNGGSEGIMLDALIDDGNVIIINTASYNTCNASS